MCGRYSFALSERQVKEHFNNVEIAHLWRTSYNIAPTQHAFVITNDQPQKLQYLAWGLVPYWSNDGKNKGKLINARMEGIEAKPSFRMPIREKRCLILADSYYEWKQYGTQKRPYRIMLNNQPLMVMAGIWDAWNQDGYMVKTFSIITSPSNTDVGHIHSRMPVILDTKEKQAEWLGDINLARTKRLLGTLNPGLLKSYPVSGRLNSTAYDEPENHVEVPEIPDLFS